MRWLPAFLPASMPACPDCLPVQVQMCRTAAGAVGGRGALCTANARPCQLRPPTCRTHCITRTLSKLSPNSACTRVRPPSLLQMWVWMSFNHLKAIWKVLVSENAIVKRLFNFEIGFAVSSGCLPMLEPGSGQGGCACRACSALAETSLPLPLLCAGDEQGWRAGERVDGLPPRAGRHLAPPDLLCRLSCRLHLLHCGGRGRRIQVRALTACRRGAAACSCGGLAWAGGSRSDGQVRDAAPSCQQNPHAPVFLQWSTLVTRPPTLGPLTARPPLPPLDRLQCLQDHGLPVCHGLGVPHSDVPVAPHLDYGPQASRQPNRPGSCAG